MEAWDLSKSLNLCGVTLLGFVVFKKRGKYRGTFDPAINLLFGQSSPGKRVLFAMYNLEIPSR